MADDDKTPKTDGGSDTPAQNGGGAAKADTDKPATQQAGPPGINVLMQYVKDLSFENPHAPAGINTTNNPKIQIAVNVNAKPIREDAFEVDLIIESKAVVAGEGEDAGDQVMFGCDLTYGGLFRVTNVPKESLHAVVMIECPRILFPFARQIIAEATRNGGFPPLMIDPIDFTALYRQKLAAEAQQAAAEPSKAN